MALIEVNNLEKTFKVKTRRFKALSGMSFEVERGEILGFLGPNGAGKSTTIKIIMDLIRADKGEVEINGLSSRDPQARKFIGFMPENPQYFDSLTGLDLLLFTASVFGIDKKQASKKAWQLLEEFGLKDAAKRPIRKYSKGMIQRVGFASTLIHEPQVLILDEPMSGLDPIGRVLFKNKMKELNKNGVTIFFSSHIIPDIEDICSRVLIVNKGKVIKSLTREEIRFLTTTGFNIITDRCLDHPKCAKISDNLYSIKTKKEELIRLLKQLEESNIKVIDIEPVKKNLEEVFVELVN